MAVQVDPIKPTLKPPGIKLSKLKYDRPLSYFAFFKFNLRRYTVGDAGNLTLGSAAVDDVRVYVGSALSAGQVLGASQCPPVGAYTRSR
jgi:hypothetical protein